MGGLLGRLASAALTLLGRAGLGGLTGPGTAEAIRHPWKETPETTEGLFADLIVAALPDKMVDWLTTPRGVHAETLLVSIGALAGFAAQAAVNARIRKRDVPGAYGGMPEPELARLLQERGLFVQVTAQSGGEPYYFGDLINGYLVEEATTVDYHLRGILAAAAVEAGARYRNLPDCAAIFARVARTVGTREFGMLHPPKPLASHLTPRQALRRFWPEVRLMLGRIEEEGAHVRPEYWPLMLALVARQHLLMTKHVIAPHLAFALIMESAIVMSKVDPRAVPLGEEA
jgi:hypothetical protein